MESKYKILPVKKEKRAIDKRWKDINDKSPLMCHPFAVVAVASPKCGKSNMLVNILLNPAYNYINRFDSIIWISPTVMTDLTTYPIRKLKENPDNELGQKITIFTDDDVEYISDIIKEILKNQKTDDKTTLLIIDDCLGYLRNGELGKLFSKYRHYGLSVFCVSQQWKMLDTITRNCCSGMILFNTYNQAERQKIFEELANIENIEQHYKTACDEKYSFLWVNFDTRKVYKNFDTLLWAK